MINDAVQQRWGRVLHHPHSQVYDQQALAAEAVCKPGCRQLKLLQLWWLSTSLIIMSLLQVIDVLHPGRANVPKVSDLSAVPLSSTLLCSTEELTQVHLMQAELRERLASIYGVQDDHNVFVFGFRAQVGTCS